MSGPPDPYRLAYLAAEFCLAESLGRYMCSREPNHEGSHRAESEDGELFDTWPKDEK